MGEGLRPARLVHRWLRQNCRCHADKVFAAQNGHTISVTIRPKSAKPGGTFRRSSPEAASSRRRRRSGGTIPAVAVALVRSRRLNGENAQLGNAELNECR